MSTPESKRRGPAWGVLVTGIVIVGAAALMAVKIRTRQQGTILRQSRQLAAAAHQGPPVQYVAVNRSPATHTMTLLGEAHPWQQTTLYAKVSGYLERIDVDKGDRVHARQTIAVIQSPELDHQYQAAVADDHNKHLIADRAAALVKQDMISHEEADNSATAAAMADATVQQLAAMRSYETLLAPFDGMVTARFADPGALLQAATNAQTSALPVVTVAQTGTLRIYVFVDQKDAAFVHRGDPVVVTDPTRPGFAIHARVSRTSGELDPKTRTLLTEVDVRNPGDRVLPGSFLEVQLHLRANPLPEVPAQALIMQGNQTFVGVITPRNRLALRPVTVAGDDGVLVRIARGVSDGEHVALNVGDRIAPGSAVQPVAAPMP